MRRESVRGYVGAPRKSQFSMMAKASNHCCLAMFSIIWAKRLMNCRASVSAPNTFGVGTNAIQFVELDSESPNSKNRGIQGAVRGDCLEPSEKSARSNRGGGRRDRKVFCEAQIRSSAAPEIPSDPAEIRRHNAADDLDLYPDVGLAIRARFRPAAF